MIVQIVEDRQVDGRWFLSPQQYVFIQQYTAPISLCKSCTKKYNQQAIMFYDILTEDKVYTIPFDMATLISGDVPSADMRGQTERWEATRTHDVTLKKGEHTDVVKQAEKYLDIDIRQHINNVQVDGNRLRELEILKEKKFGH